MRINEIMYKTRNTRNLLRKEAASIIGVSSSYYRQLENGNKSPRPKMLVKIANGFHIPVDLFFKEENKQYLINSVIALIMMTPSDERQTLCDILNYVRY
ncbi:hypothetical protein IMSAG013_00826 [Clostridiales bacterium]|nr:hypothetical protein IMSAG013_00826 [Clostridiales bacterium]